MEPLRATRVLDLTHAFAGPLCTLQLQLYGADVVKLERPGPGDDFRTRGDVFGGLNAGKRSVAVDLKSTDGRAVFDRLLARSDVLVENFRPGAARKLGIDWESVSGDHPSLIYCSITGFGQEGPWAGKPAIEWSTQSTSGLADTYIPADADPMYLGVNMLDPFTGYMAFTAILAALLERGRTGRGQHLDVAMIDAAFMLMASRIPGRLREEAGSADAAALLARRRPTMARFATTDGDIFIGALHQRWWEALCRELGAEDLLDDPRFADQRSRQANVDATWSALQERIRARSGYELEQRLNELGLPAAVVRPFPDVARAPHVVDRGSLQSVQVAETGEDLTVVGAGIGFGGEMLRHRGPVPSVGQHTDEVLRELGFDAGALQQLRSTGAVA